MWWTPWSCVHRTEPLLPAGPLPFGTDGSADLDPAETAFLHGLEQALGRPVVADARLSITATRLSRARLDDGEWPETSLDGWLVSDGVVVVPFVRMNRTVAALRRPPDPAAWAALVAEAVPEGAPVVGLGTARRRKQRAWVLIPAQGGLELEPIPRDAGPHPLRARLEGTRLRAYWYPDASGRVGSAEGEGAVEAELPAGVRAVSVVTVEPHTDRQVEVARFRAAVEPVRGWTPDEVRSEVQALRARAGLPPLADAGIAPCAADDGGTGLALGRRARCWTYGANPSLPLGAPWSELSVDPSLLRDVFEPGWDALGLAITADSLEVDFRHVVAAPAPGALEALVAARPTHAGARAVPEASSALRERLGSLDPSAFDAGADALRDDVLRGRPLLAGGTRWFAIGYGEDLADAVGAAAANVDAAATRYAVADRVMHLPDRGWVHVVALVSSGSP